ncbi:MAG: glycerol-3-phosphate 1-O-acyltransferase PlsY [Atopostipes sp.]|nr:glycerol-3-phosphate 1-O-acyltransferase PlsY [Atopostipes sp.]
MAILIQIILAYLLGSIPSGVWLGKILYNKDIRDYGSGNTGATNTFRIIGVKAGVLALIFDVLKGLVATLIPIYLGTTIHPIFIGLFAILGHVFSLYINFQGGKAVATSAGVLLAIHPIYLISAVFIFLIILFVTSTVSIASILASILAAIASIFLQDSIFSIVVWLITLGIIYLHRENIDRIKKGVESRVPFGLNPKEKE